MTMGPWVGTGVLVLGGRRIEGARYRIAVEADPQRRGGLHLKGTVTVPPGALRLSGQAVVITNSPMGTSETLELETGESISIVPIDAVVNGIVFLVNGGMPGMQVF